MTTCNDIQRKFLDHDWDQAALDDAAAIAEHLKHCGECRTAISQYEQLRTLLRIPGPVPEAPGPEAPVAVAALPEGRPGRTFRRRPVEQWAWTAALAVSLLIGVIGWTLYLRVPRGEAQLASSPTPAANHALPAGGNLAASRQPCNGRKRILRGRCKSLKTSPKPSAGKPVGWPWAIAAAIWA